MPARMSTCDTLPLPSAADSKPLLTVRECARILRVSEQFVRDHAAKRKRPYLRRIKAGKAVRIHPDDLRRFIQENTE